MADSPDIFNFNGQDYEFIVRLYNGANDIKLNNTAWEDLFLEEDIFDWKIKGSIILRNLYEGIQKSSVEANILTNKPDEKLIYKFRNDGRDTLYITIKPKPPQGMPGLEKANAVIFSDKKWRLEIEATIYDVEDLPNTSETDKRMKLYFWEKTYQMMTEKDSDFSTATTGSNSGKPNTSQLNNNERALKTGESLAELIKNDEDFKKHLINTAEWENGDDDVKINFTSPVGAKFIDDLEYLLNYTLASKMYNNEPCILKFERAEQKEKPKQFSLKTIKKYFEKAGKGPDSPGEYQIEHFFIYDHENQKNNIVERKAPLNKTSEGAFVEIKGDNYNSIRNYRLIDLSGINHSKNLTNYRIVSFNSTNGQFNEESVKHTYKEYKDFFKNTIQPSILTNNAEDRLVPTKFIENSLNTKSILSLRKDEIGRLADGRNSLLKYYLFTNLAISFFVRGSTHRQTGRFFGLSKTTSNHQEFDHKLEGQYFVTNVIHHFSNSGRNYTNEIIGVKTHTYAEVTKFQPDDLLLIK